MAEAPSDALLDAWLGYVHELAAKMTPDDRRAFADEILDMVSRFAEEARKHRRFNAEGSIRELRVIDRIERALLLSPYSTRGH